MNLADICNLIRMPGPVTEEVLARESSPAVEAAEVFSGYVMSPDTWEDGLTLITAAIGDDPDGMSMLAFMLKRAAETHDEYVRLGIDDTIFADTMGFFTRFVEDHHRTYGSYAFTWGFHVPRQISLREFRIGELEYEMVIDAGAKHVNVHVPADASLERDRLRRSALAARDLLARLFPEFAQAEMLCDSWLLSPNLPRLLPVSSRILVFRSGFEILSVKRHDTTSLRWVWGREDLPLSQLEERTSLQRAIKSVLLADGWIGAAVGKLVENPWAEAESSPEL